MRHLLRPREGGRRSLALTCVIAVFVLGGAVACRGAQAEVPLTNAAPSKEALAQAVVDALWAQDVGRLEALALTEAEFRQHIWPKLPASRPEVGMPADYVWADTVTKSRGHMARRVSDLAGRRLAVEGVAFEGGATDYGPFRVYPHAELTLRDDRGGVSRHRLFGSMVESAGSWKVYSYIVD